VVEPEPETAEAVPQTAQEPPAPARTTSVLPAAIQGSRVAVSMDVKATRIRGGHHEGLLKVRQPWIYGLSKEQRRMIYDNAPQVAALAFCAGMQEQGLRVDPEGAAYSLAGTVQSVTINTYGHGTKEGFGSAGNYWDAKVQFADLRLVDLATGAVLWQGSPSAYARLAPCPAQLDWTILDVLTRSMKGAMILSKLEVAGDVLKLAKGGKDYLENWSGSYTLGDLSVTPIDAAARQAAAEMLAKAAWPGK
jgi:hypothetical protein